jgi:hypothetical protein
MICEALGEKCDDLCGYFGKQKAPIYAFREFIGVSKIYVKNDAMYPACIVWNITVH